MPAPMKEGKRCVHAAEGGAGIGRPGGTALIKSFIGFPGLHHFIHSCAGGRHAASHRKYRHRYPLPPLAQPQPC
jgi:hypothetical protein